MFLKKKKQNRAKKYLISSWTILGSQLNSFFSLIFKIIILRRSFFELIFIMQQFFYGTGFIIRNRPATKKSLFFNRYLEDWTLNIPFVTVEESSGRECTQKWLFVFICSWKVKPFRIYFRILVKHWTIAVTWIHQIFDSSCTWISYAHNTQHTRNYFDCGSHGMKFDRNLCHMEWIQGRSMRLSIGLHNIILNELNNMNWITFSPRSNVVSIDFHSIFHRSIRFSFRFSKISIPLSEQWRTNRLKTLFARESW